MSFVKRGEPESKEKNYRSKARINNKRNPHLTPSRNWTRAIFTGGERSYHCAILPPNGTSVFTTSQLSGLNTWSWSVYAFSLYSSSNSSLPTLRSGAIIGDSRLLLLLRFNQRRARDIRKKIKTFWWSSEKSRQDVLVCFSPDFKTLIEYRVVTPSHLKGHNAITKTKPTNKTKQTKENKTKQKLTVENENLYFFSSPSVKLLAFT